MAYLLVQHTVEDYNKWKPIFDEHGATRKAAGSLGGRVFRNSEEPNKVTILFEWDTVENARAFAESDTLRQAMQRAGVMGPPTVSFLNETAVPQN